MAKFSVQEVIELVREASKPEVKGGGKKKETKLFWYGFAYRERGCASLYVSTGPTFEGETNWRKSMLEKKDKVVLSEVFEIEVPASMHADAHREKAEDEAAKNAV